ncbi:SCY1 protein kinase [Loa loa]|uniref:SCY1 protein kinase n=1 Tax=Loa loa TaxID=7209 RepID=A0A1I7VC77_LOALO|nr:SCY1 protein kinase [Loa loa]EFO20697.1 SCY1 protein kinase [Loa loa]
MAINVDYYLNRIRSTVTSVAAQVSNALPGNPVTRDYEVLSQVGSAGPAFSWKVYAAQKRSTKKPVSVWLFEKRSLEKWPRYERELFSEILKRGVSQLTRLRHPRILIIEHPLEESRDSYAFCTEPVFASLANAVGRLDNISPCPVHLNEFELLDIEIRYGLFQVVEALSFLHIDVRMMHRNISPESVIINEKGEWKLAGFDFAVQATQGTNNQVMYEMLEWNQRTMSVVQPLLDYLAPEYVIGGRCDPYADIFSFGIMALTVFNKGKQPFDNRNSLDNFRRNTEKLNTLPVSMFVNVPAELRDDLKMCLNLTPDLRPDATQFSKIVYFDEPLIRTLNSLDSLCQMDYTQKMNFFKQLPQFLLKFPKRPLIQKILPQLCAEFIAAELVPFILPSVFYIAGITSNDEFAVAVLPQLVPIFTLERPYQISLLFLQNMDLLLQKTSEEDARKYLLPLICNALSSETVKIQELCLSIVPKVATMVERQSMKTEVLPKLLQLIIDGGGVLAIRVQALLCIGKLLPSLEPWMVTDQIIPALPKVISREPAILMAILGIYKLAYEESRFGITREQCARSILPFLIASSMENTLNMPQFELYMALIHRILDRIEKEQRQRLQQLSASQEEQRSIGEFASILGEPAAQNKDSLSDNLTNLIIDGSTDGKPNGIDRNTGLLSLAAKKRLAAEREQNLRMRSQPNLLQPVSARESTNKSETKTPDSFISPIDSAVDVVGCSSLVPSASISTYQTHIDLSDFLPAPSISEKVKNESTLSSMDNPVWPDPFKTGPNNSLTSFVLQPTINTISLPDPPVVQNPVSRRGSGQRMTTNRAGNASLNEVDRKLNMSAFDDIVCFPTKHNTKNNFTLNSQNNHSKQNNLINDVFGDLLK